MTTLKGMKARIAELKKERKPLEKARDRYMKLGWELESLQKKVYESEKQNKLRKLEFATDYREPEYPGMGVTSCIGYAAFKDRDQAESLVDSLRGRSYRFGYVLEWSGAGVYDVEPSYHSDHDGDTIYTATFKKCVETDALYCHDCGAKVNVKKLEEDGIALLICEGKEKYCDLHVNPDNYQCEIDELDDYLKEYKTLCT